MYFDDHSPSGRMMKEGAPASADHPSENMTEAKKGRGAVSFVGGG